MMCPVCGDEVSFGLLKDENGNFMCEECYIRIQVRIANGDAIYYTPEDITTTFPKNKSGKIKNTMKYNIKDIT